MKDIPTLYYPEDWDWKYDPDLGELTNEEKTFGLLWCSFIRKPAATGLAFKVNLVGKRRLNLCCLVMVTNGNALSLRDLQKLGVQPGRKNYPQTKTGTRLSPSF